MQCKVKFLVTFLIIAVMFSCSPVPISGRKQFTIITNQSLLADSYSTYQDVLSESLISNDYAEVRRLRRIGGDIADAAERYLAQTGASHLTDGFQWEFNLIESDVPNAFCMPGGKVAFFTGILSYCENDDGMATIMGHEVAHAIAWHAAEQLSKQTIISTGLDLLGSLFSPSATVKELVYVASDLVKLEYSRRHEAEADHIGLVLMAMAGYDPQEAPRFWERMTALGDGAIGLLSSHPPSSKRVKNLQKLMPEAMKYYQSRNN